MINEKGFHRLSEIEYVQEFSDLFEAEFTDEQGNVPSLEPESFLGVWSGALGGLKNELMQELEEIYYNSFASTASGVSLERQLQPISRRNATRSTGTQAFYGGEGQEILAGFIVETEDERQYETTETGTIDETGILYLPIQSVNTGISQNAPIGAVRFIPVPLPGLDTSENITQMRGGANVEPENEYRERGINAKRADKTSSLLAIENAVRNVDNVIDAFVAENTGEDIDSEGRPPGSVEAIIEGGQDDQIGQALYNVVAGGVETFGEISVLITDSKGDLQPIFFSRVEEIELFARVQIVVNLKYNSEIAVPTIKQKILEYIGGVDQDSVTWTGEGIGATLYGWKATANIYQSPDLTIQGIESVETFLGTSTPAIDSKIVLSARQKAFIDVNNIVIEDVTP